jgi:hypothetical protein
VGNGLFFKIQFFVFFQSESPYCVFLCKFLRRTNYGNGWALTARIFIIRHASKIKFRLAVSGTTIGMLDGNDSFFGFIAPANGPHFQVSNGMFFKIQLLMLLHV